jgi:hypothetical protein
MHDVVEGVTAEKCYPYIFQYKTFTLEGVVFAKISMQVSECPTLPDVPLYLK